MMWPLSAQGNTKDKGKEKRKKYQLGRAVHFVAPDDVPKGGKRQRKRKKKKYEQLGRAFPFVAPDDVTAQDPSTTQILKSQEP